MDNLSIVSVLSEEGNNSNNINDNLNIKLLFDSIYDDYYLHIKKLHEILNYIDNNHLHIWENPIELKYDYNNVNF